MPSLLLGYTLHVTAQRTYKAWTLLPVYTSLRWMEKEPGIHRHINFNGYLRLWGEINEQHLNEAVDMNSIHAIH